MCFNSSDSSAPAGANERSTVSSRRWMDETMALKLRLAIGGI